MKQIFKDPFQKKAINLDMGPAMIFAGPGSGKTFIITHRILHYILERKIRPSEILVITFTKAAANEMKKRFTKLNPMAANYVSFGTFHSIFFYFLRSFSNNIPTIISSERKIELLRQIVNGKTTDQYEDIEMLSFDISKYKNNSYKFDKTFSMTADDRIAFLEIFNLYQTVLKNLNYIDYDDILINFYDMLLNNPQIKASIKERYKAILVDEFQDINNIQYQILKEIVPDNNNIFVVGDDDQSIYGFRGAKPEIMKTFTEDFSDAQLVELKYNYRSFQQIIDPANKLICHNEFRMKSNAQSSVLENTSLDDKGKCDSPFQVLVFKSKYEQDLFIIDYTKKINADSVGILSRTNKDCFYYKKLLSDDQSVIEDDVIINEMLSDIRYYLLAAKESKREYYLEIANKPNRYLPKSLFENEHVDIKAMAHKSLGSYYGNNLQIFSRHMDVLKKSSPFPFVKYLFDFVGYKNYMLEKYPAQNERVEAAYERIKLMSKDFSGVDSFIKFIDKNFLKETSEKKGLVNRENMGITTYHSSKGLEFDTVILPDLCEGNVPGRISLKNDNLEEERRLFYVAMTRARKKLLLLTIKNEESASMLPSRFISELE